MPTISIRAYIEIAAALIIVAGVIAWTMHERSIGATKIKAADAAATIREQNKAKVETRRLAAQAQKADQNAIDTQKKLDAYVAANPIGPIYLSVRHEDDCRVSLPQAPTNPSQAANTATRPSIIPTMPQGTYDASVGLAILVRAASELAIIDQQWQQRQVGAP